MINLVFIIFSNFVLVYGISLLSFSRLVCFLIYDAYIYNVCFLYMFGSSFYQLLCKRYRCFCMSFMHGIKLVKA